MKFNIVNIIIFKHPIKIRYSLIGQLRFNNFCIFATVLKKNCNL